ncbi:MAG: ABC transporter permease, partial [Oryzihumus sp.]
AAVGVWQIWRKHAVVQGIIALGTAAVVGLWFVLSSTVPDEITGMTPYVATLLVLAFASQRLRMPAADGQPYRKGEGH